jgi:hypothetical protein
MSATSTFTGTGLAGGGSMARVTAGASAVPVDHAIDLAFFFSHDSDARQDALVSETRRQLGGCVAAVEIALRLSLAHAPALDAALDLSPAPLAWAMIGARPTLIAPALLAHMRMRAGVALMLRQYGQGDIDQSGAALPGPLPAADDPKLGDAVAALALAEGRWLVPGGEDQPLRPDLPAELFADLVWTVAACLARAAERAMGGADDALYAAFDRSGWALLADHDEDASPLAQADHIVRRMGDGADDPLLLGAALDQRRFLLFAALAARRLRVGTGQLVEMLLLGPIGDVALACRALGGSDADYRQLLLSLRPVRPSLSDAAIVAAADAYAQIGQAQADAAVAALRTAPLFRARLDHLRGLAGS